MSMTEYKLIPVGATLIDSKNADTIVRKVGDTITFLSLQTGETFEFTPNDGESVHDYQIHYPCREAP